MFFLLSLPFSKNGLVEHLFSTFLKLDHSLRKTKQMNICAAGQNLKLFRGKVNVILFSLYFQKV